ncbi:MAG: hypothetical protein EBU90_02665 [Proteobacteria bacterium]|nr:hypothetical protein [Pseudomonadota bacterium]NBP13139.1 hypothetical protein [bacterium]
MALSYIRFTELDAVSSVDTNAILPVVETITNVNKKITVSNFNSSLPVQTDVTVLKATSSNWDKTYTTVNSNSAGWESVETSVLVASASWSTASLYSAVYSANSGKYESVYTSLNATSAVYNNSIRFSNWDSSYTTTNKNSASWSSVYSSYNAVSSTGFNPFVGAGIASNGTQGLVPAPQGGEDNANLAGDGTFHLNVWDQAQPGGSYVTGVSYYEPFMITRNRRDWSFSSSNAGLIFLTPFRITHTITLSALRLYSNSTASAAGTTAKLAIYKWRTQYSKPRVTDLVSSNFNTLDLTQTGGLMSYATSPLTLVRGLYFVAFAMSGATGTIVGLYDPTVYGQLFTMIDYANVWPAAGFYNTPAIQMSTVGTSYAALWPASLSPNSSSIYNITVVDATTPLIHMIGTP